MLKMKQYWLFLLLSLTIFASHLVNEDSPIRSEVQKVLAVSDEHHQTCSSHPAFEQMHPHDQIRVDTDKVAVCFFSSIRIFFSFNQLSESNYTRFFWQPPKLV